jgi:hypothetical protein
MLCVYLINCFLKFIHILDWVLKVTHLVWNAIKCSLCLQSANQDNKKVEEGEESPKKFRLHPMLLVLLITLEEVSTPNIDLIA